MKHYDKDTSSAFTLDWEYQLDGGTWQNLAQTKHTIYVTLADPEKYV